MHSQRSIGRALVAIIVASTGCQALLDFKQYETSEREPGSTDGAIAESGAPDGSTPVGDDAALDGPLADGPNDAASDVILEAGTAMIYLRAPPTRGDFLSIANADALCDTVRPAAVQKAKAILVGASRTACTSPFCASGGATEHVDWPLRPYFTYLREDLTPIGTTNGVGIFPEPLSNAVLEVASTQLVWTGLAPGDGGTSWLTGANCSEWTSVLQGVSGYAGYGNLEGDAFGKLLDTCNQNNGLYCVQVSP